MAKNEEHQSCKLIVASILKGKINWGREIKIAKKLLVEYPDRAFWESLYMDTYPTSLSIFLTNGGKKFLIKQYREFKLTESSDEIKLEESPVVAIVPTNVTKKPKTIQQFVDQ